MYHLREKEIKNGGNIWEVQYIPNASTEVLPRLRNPHTIAGATGIPQLNNVDCFPKTLRVTVPKQTW